MGQGGGGFSLNPVSGAGGTLVVVRSVASDNGGAGVAASGSGAVVYVSDSTVVRNATGFSQGDGAVFNTCGDNLAALNGTASAEAISAPPCNP